MKRILATIVGLVALCGAVRAEETQSAEFPVAGPPFSVALDTLGATATVSKCGFNPDWPASRLLTPDGGSGLLLNPPMKGAFIEIRLLAAVPITAIEISLLDYHGTRFIKTVDIYVDGKLVKKGVEFGNEVEEVKDAQGRVRQRIAPRARVELSGVKGQVVGIDVTDVHPPRDLGDGKKGAEYGVINRVRIFSSEDIANLVTMPDGYKVQDEKAIAFSAALASVPKVYAEVRETPKGVNPNTIWDAKDIEHMRELLKKSPEMQAQLQALRNRLDERMTQPIVIPAGKKDDKGEWRHVSDQEDNYGKMHNQLSLDISDLGILYALTGEAKYAEFAKKILIAYAKEYVNYRPGNRPGFQHDAGMLFDQRLSDAIWLLRAIRGYDLIANNPSWTPEERQLVATDFLGVLAHYIAANRSMLMANTNWSVIGTAAVLLTGYAIHDDVLIDKGLYGWTDPKGERHGGMYFHFGPASIDADGMWSEGAMGYQFMALEGLIAYAETMLHHGVNMYEYRDGAFKHLFDSPLWFSYPNLVAPAIHDSGSSKILGYDANVWEYAYLRYRDPNYLTLLKEIPQRIHSRYQIFAESVLWDLDKDQLAPPIAVGSTNLHGVGYGITRVNSAELGQQYLLLDYGPNRSHGHPDKLNIDLWVNGEQLIIDPGMVWYEQPMYRRWFNKSIAHNTLIVDETDQRASGAVQTVFASGETVAMQRAYATDAVPGVTMDRTLFMFERYVIDIFGAFAKMPRLYDLAWHIRGDFTLPEGMKEREKFTAVGYVELDEVKKLTTKDGFSVGFTSPEKGSRSRFFAAPGVETTFITGLGHYGKERPLTIIARRNVADTIFASAVDYSGTGDYVKSITGSGDVTKGFYLAKAVTQSGTDLAYTSFNGVKNTADTLTTDALQALVRFDDKDAVYTAAIAGGTTLTNGAFALELSDKGIVIVERTLAGTWLINNQLDTEVTLTLKADFTKGLNIVALNADGSHGKAAPAAFTGTIMLPALGKFELLPAGNDGYFKTALKIRAEAQAAAEKAAVEAKAIAEARAKERRDAAAAAPVTGFRVEIPAIAFTAETGGTVKKLTDRAATQTKEGIVQGWQGAAHALTWEVEAPAAGYYILGARYCTEMKDPVREIKINGEVQEPLSPFIFPTTGGWARSNDDWKFAYALDSVDGKPLLLKLTAGKNTITLTSNDGLGVNLDFLVVASPDAAAIAK